MSIVGGLDIHRRQVTFDVVDTVTGQAWRGQLCPADREHVRAWLGGFAGCGEVHLGMEGCTGWRYVAEEVAAAGFTAHVGDPAEIAVRRGPKRRAKTDRADARLQRELLARGDFPAAEHAVFRERPRDLAYSRASIRGLATGTRLRLSYGYEVLS